MANQLRARKREAQLKGLNIMVTRARHQAAALSGMIEAAGGRALRVPMIEIEGTTATDEVIQRLTEFHLAIFVSANAVQHALPRIHACGANLARLRLAAIGRKTAAALEESGYPIDIYPRQEFTSEALLALPAMQRLAGQHVIIFRGEGGRELLADTLRARGAMVEYAEVYRRVVPPVDSRRLAQHLHEAHLITIASAQALRNLDGIVSPVQRAAFHKASLLVGGSRMLELARKMSFADAGTARDPSDEAMFEGILCWASRRRGVTI